MKESSKQSILPGFCRIVEAYKNYSPPVPVAPVLEKLLDGISSLHLIGIRSIVCTNRGFLSNRNQRGIDNVLGRYYKEWRGEGAWIELFIDGGLAGAPKSVLRIPLFRELLLADTLFHEIGHHIHATKAPEFADNEKVAEKWKTKLLWRYFSRHHPYIIPISFCVWSYRRIKLKTRRLKNKSRM